MGEIQHAPPVFINNIYETWPHVCLHIIYGCFPATIARYGSSHRIEYGAQSQKHLLLVLYKKSLTNLGLD